MKNTTHIKRAPALERGLKVLDLLAEEGSELSLRTIAQRLDIPVPSLWRIMGVLKESGYVLFDHQNKTYRLGFKFLYIGNILMNRIGFRSQAREYLNQLVERTGETAELSARVKDQLILIEQVEGPDAVRLFSRVGSAYPYFHATAPGKVYLAHLDRSKLSSVMTRMGLPGITDHTLISMAALEEELQSVIRNGYACDMEEMRVGVCRVASPIYDRAGRVIVCLGIAAPSFRMGPADLERVGETVKDLAQQLSRELKEQGNKDWLAFEAFHQAGMTG